jgi:hypothetical protein
MEVGARLTICSLKLFSPAYYANRGGRTVSRDTAFDYLKILVNPVVLFYLGFYIQKIF